MGKKINITKENEEKKSSKKSPITGAKQFTSDYQPSKKSRSIGQKKRWDYAKAREEMYRNLCEVSMPDGKTLNFWELVVKKFHGLILTKESLLSEKEKAELMLKLCKEFMPETKQLKVESGRPVIIKFDSSDEKL